MHCNMADYNSVSHEVDSVEQKPDEQSVSFTQVGLSSSLTSTASGPLPNFISSDSQVNVCAVRSSSSCSENVCRICQLSNKSSDADLQSTECDCRGNLSKVHHSCLKEWVRYKGSNKCEICNSHFACVTPPVHPGIFQLEAFHQLAWHLERNRPFNRRKRAMLGTALIVLLLVTCVMSLLTVGADREYENAAGDPWISKKNLNESNVIFSVCIAFAFFCATLTVGLLLIWFGVECCFTIHRRGVLRRATVQLLHNENRA
ncbi:E3 ubiquitin-protein ligase MARCHF8-like [Ostrea edulis]|uniref:E3 ubiquitin-protein ligase MARCHF8-like n=1 Tax=Ostrea edulis TaxID=37623 RepID=UPI0024AF58BA|nr:E3 ubiquitin-protein ligase MARCHF8-like [Ostrea edulis]